MVIMLYSKQTAAQGETMYPIGEYYVPDVELSNTSGTIQGPSNVYLGGSHGSNYFKANGSSNLTVKGEKVVIRRSHIGGNTQAGFRFAAKPGGPSIASNYSYANGPPDVPLFEKIEFGIKLPAFVQNKINAFLNENISAVNHTNDYLNPYDPEDVSIEAVISFSQNTPAGIINVSSIVNGFYFEDYIVDVANDAYIETPENYPFRIRIAPKTTGIHSVTILLKYKSGSNLVTLPISGSIIDINSLNGTPNIIAGNSIIEFNAINNNQSRAKHKGYLEVGHHKRHLRHSGSQTSFFPLGMNLQELPKIGNYLYNGPVAYNTRRSLYFQSLKDNGGNFVRTISMNSHHCIETTWEGEYDPALSTQEHPHYNAQNQNKLGNYHSNQKHMKEIDLDVIQAENLDLFLLFCLQIHYPFMESAIYGGGINGAERWGNNSYRIELNLDTNPTQMNVKNFFIDTDAKRFFKNKLRYAQARWGYSPAIAIWQLVSEMDQFGMRAGIDFNGNSLNGQGPYYANSSHFDISHLMAINQWTCEMSAFLGAQYPKHLIASNYIVDPFANNFGSNYGACSDQSHTCMGVDLITQNSYNYDGIEWHDRSTFEKVVNIIYNPDNDACIGEEAGYFIEKPYQITETANKFMDSDNCQTNSIHNSSWAALCSGQMGTPLLWNLSTAWNLQNRKNLPDYFSNYYALKSFVSGIDFETHKYRPSTINTSNLDHSGGDWEDGPDVILWPASLIVNDNDESMDNMEIFIMQNDNSGIGQKSDRGFGWLHNKNYTWKTETGGWDTVTNTCFGPIYPWQNDLNVNSLTESQKYYLNGFRQGEYIINIFDTETGNQIGGDISAHANFANQLKFKIPFITLNETTPDIAFKFRHQDLNNSSLRIADASDSAQIEDINNKKNIIPLFPHNVQVFPNPTYGEIFIINQNKEKLKFKILNQLGETVMNGSLDESNRINIKSLSVGIYYLSLSNDFINYTQKIVKQ